MRPRLIYSRKNSSFPQSIEHSVGPFWWRVLTSYCVTACECQWWAAEHTHMQVHVCTHTHLGMHVCSLGAPPAVSPAPTPRGAKD